MLRFFVLIYCSFLLQSSPFVLEGLFLFVSAIPPFPTFVFFSAVDVFGFLVAINGLRAVSCTFGF